LDVTQDPARVAPQRAQRLAHAAELPGVGEAPGPGGQARGLAVVVLPQPDPDLLRQRHQGATGRLVEPAVGRVRDRLLHHRRVHDHPGEAALGERARRAARLDGLGQQPLRPFLADAIAPAAERGGVKGQAVLEEHFAGEVLKVRVLHPAGEDGLVGEAIGVLQVHQARDQARMQSGPPLRGGEEAGPVLFEPGPVDQRRQPDQFVPRVDHVEQAWTRRVGVFGRAGAVPHGGENRRVRAQFQPNPAISERPTRPIVGPDQRIGCCSRATNYCDRFWKNVYGCGAR
jgi:hypothetical protein